jgi:predicted GIY-YIG superfamily endonuclease
MIGRVYKITNKDESIVYIGSTTESIHRRFKRHTYGFKQWQDGKADRCHSMIYHSFLKHGIDSVKISLVTEHEIDNPRQLHEFEQLVIDQTSCVKKKCCISYG